MATIFSQSWQPRPKRSSWRATTTAPPTTAPATTEPDVVSTTAPSTVPATTEPAELDPADLVLAFEGVEREDLEL